MTALIAANAFAAHAQAAEDDALPDAGEVVAAYLALRTWTNELAPPALADPQARLPLTGVSGVHVTLRRFGRVVGSASAIHGLDGDRDLLARRAVGRALAQSLGDPAVANLPRELRDTIGDGLTLEIDVAGRLEPVLGRTYERIARDLEPGLDGVAMRTGDQWVMLFPSQLLASNTADRIATRLPGLVAELGLPARELNVLIQQHGLSIYRFRTLQLVQTDPRSFPFETIRGDTLVPMSAVTVQGIADFADGLAAHLLGKIHEAEPDNNAGVEAGVATHALGLLGDYHPVADAYRPLTAPPLDQALVSFALSRYAAAPRVAGDVAEQAHRQAGRLLRDLHAAVDSERLDPAVAAAIVYAAAAHIEAGGADTESETIRQLHDAAAETIANVQITQVPGAHAQALIAGAAAHLLASKQGAVIEAHTVRDMLDAAWQAVPEHQYIALLPWIGWGELDYAQATGQPLARTDDLRQIRDVLEASRVTAAIEDAGSDLYGGFALADGVAARPTAQVTRPAVFLATMLRHPALTASEEVSPNLGRHLQTMRFFMQLSVREQSTWSMRNPDRALGGIRAATFNNDMPNPAQAMALLTAVETLQSLAHAAR